MAESLFRDKDQYNCSVCLDLMTDPVTIPCGHSYCINCIKEYWIQDQHKKTRCPQCRHEFSSRPSLNKNTMLAEILENLRSTTLQDAPPGGAAQCAAQPGDVQCDFCTGVKSTAVRSCLECRASYCETHLQPHFDFPALRKHKLVAATDIQTCPRHDKLLEAFCRTDNTCICMSCVMDEHKGHDTVSSAAERDTKQVRHSSLINPLLLLQSRGSANISVYECIEQIQIHTLHIRSWPKLQRPVNKISERFPESVREI